ncbi:MAG TPA: uracil-DNA glycosylase [Casimicrobiaceae bacterium]|nr:uracil-DNA glycosylase [Casimicrobiaceae bacterium]
MQDGVTRILPEPSAPDARYDAACRRCTRLATFRDDVKRQHPDYWCKPVPPFGARDARLVIVGLAPGMHGANASGRPFTGDYAGILLYQTLFDFGYANQPTGSSVGDGLVLTGCRINNSVKCLPPDNKPLPVEMANCNSYLAADLASVAPGAALLALGRIAHDAALRALELKASAFPFAHGVMHRIDRTTGEIALFDSYHCSRYNTNTGRLTVPMFRSVFESIGAYLQ